MKVAICVPARDTVCTGFAYDLARLSAHFYGRAPVGTSMTLHFVSGTLIADQRQKMAEKALRDGCDHILFLDSDMRFPAYVLDRLLAHDKDIIACNYPTRRLPVKTVAFSDFSNLSCITSLDKVGLQEVDAVGMGVMLVKAEVFRKLPKPWFQISYLPNAGMYIGEDIYFCKLAQAHGYKVSIDHDLSKEVGHIGSFEYHHAHVEISDDEGLQVERLKDAL